MEENRPIGGFIAYRRNGGHYPRLKSRVMAFWSRGYCVSTIGLDEETIRRYLQDQEDADRNQSRLEFE